ncbi:YqiJ family protein [Desulfogranum mediterraneum]|uniref:YqiJ family protein n=1 Tax=Desulfogranum mediterraneum TaxID=160661 RepID=UPI0004275D06|nr:YqiJ family protein [Desulfogranum mediterraneum]
MISFLLAPENSPFTVALVMMLAIALVEGITTLIGAGLSDLLESVLPELELDLDADLDADLQAPGVFTRFLSWLRIGQVPVLILAIVFLTVFGLLGLISQSVSAAIRGAPLPAWLAVLPTLLLALPLVRISNGVLVRILPKDETESVSEESFIGRIAVITLGRASKGRPAQARLKDQFGQAHYIMVEPDSEETCLDQGSTVLIVSRKGAGFTAIENPSQALSP